SGQQGPMPDNGDTKSDGQDVRTLLTLEQSSPGDDNGQNTPPQDSGISLTDHTEGSLQPGMSSLFSGSNGRDGNLSLNVGGFGAVQGKGGPKNSFTGSANLPSDGLGAGSGSVSSGVHNLGLSTGTLSNQGKTSDVLNVLRDGR